MSTLEVNKITPSTGTSITLGDSGDTFTIPSGVTITNNGTQTGFGGVMTPAFRAYQGSSQNISSDTTTTLNIDTENFDTDGAFNTSTYRFQPTVSGKYFLFATQRFNNTTNYDTNFDLYIRKNGSQLARARGLSDHQDSRSISTIESLNGSTDYVDIAVFQSTGATQTSQNGEIETFFGGFKIIE